MICILRLLAKVVNIQSVTSVALRSSGYKREIYLLPLNSETFNIKDIQDYKHIFLKMLKTQVSKFLMKTYTTEKRLYLFFFRIYQFYIPISNYGSLPAQSLLKVFVRTLLGMVVLNWKNRQVVLIPPFLPSFPTLQSLFQETLLHITIFSQNTQRQISHWQSRILYLKIYWK